MQHLSLSWFIAKQQRRDARRFPALQSLLLLSCLGVNQGSDEPGLAAGSALVRDQGRLGTSA